MRNNVQHILLANSLQTPWSSRKFEVKTFVSHEAKSIDFSCRDFACTAPPLRQHFELWYAFSNAEMHRKHNYSKDEQNKRSTRSVRIRPHAHVWPKIERTERDRHFQNSALPRRESEPSDTNMEKIRKYIINQR